MRIGGHSWSDIKDAMTFQGDYGREKPWTRSDWLGKLQGLSNMPLSPVAFMHGFAENKYASPYGPEAISPDRWSGGFLSDYKGARSLGRAVGSYYGGYGLNALAGSPYAAPAARGLGAMFGGGETGGGGTQSGTSSNIFDYAHTYHGGEGPSPYSQVAGLDPNLYSNVEDIKDKGRYGDNNLLHVSDDELNALKSTGKVTENPETGLPEAFGLSDVFGGGGGAGGILGPIGSMIGANKQKQDLTGLAQTASQASNPLAAPQRQQYQGQLAGMMTPQGAQTFMTTDPSIQAQRQMIADQMRSTFGKSGNLPLTGIMGSAQLANAMGGQYNQRIQDLMTLGGFTMANPYGGMPYTSLMGPMQTQNAAMFGGIGNLLPMIGQGLGSLFGGGGSFGTMAGGGEATPELVGNAGYFL